MHCPHCDHSGFVPTEVCPACGFRGDPAQLEELARLKWLLAEVEGWGALGIGEAARHVIARRYEERLRTLEITLHLRPPPFTAEEAPAAWRDLIHRQTLLARIPDWFRAGWLKQKAAEKLLDRLGGQIDDLTGRLEGHPRPKYPQTDADLLALTNFLLEATDYLSESDGFTSPEAAEALKNPLLTEKERLEIALGLRAEPVQRPVVHEQVSKTPPPQTWP